jgi:hypothetical protein
MLLPTLAERGAVREPLAARPVPRGYEPVESDRHQTRTVTADAHAAAILARGGDFRATLKGHLGPLFADAQGACRYGRVTRADDAHA